MAEKEKMVINIPVRKPGDFDEGNESHRDSQVEDMKKEDFEGEVDNSIIELMVYPENFDDINDERSKTEIRQKSDNPLIKSIDGRGRIELFRDSAPRFAIGHKLSKTKFYIITIFFYI